ncbi:MAG: glycosyltransferase [Devosia sp.]
MTQRVVFHTPTLKGGGAERVFALMANEFAARGQDVTLFTWNADGPNAALLSDKVSVIDLGLPQSGGRFGKLTTLRGLLRSIPIIRRVNPDAVYSGPEFANLLTMLMLVLAGSKAIFFPTAHAASAMRATTLGERLTVALSRLIAWRATKVIGVSDGVGRDLVERGFPASKVIAINNPFLPMSGRQAKAYGWYDELQAMGAGPLIGTVGRLTEVKDHFALLRAFASLLRRRPARLVIFGDGPLREELIGYADSLRIGDRVLFPGYVEDVAACYEALEVFVLSSTTEGFGNVLVEAMASGVPVVSTDAPYGPREIMRDGALGPLVPVGDHEALAAAIEQQLDKPTEASLLKQRAADFGIDKIGERYLALLKSSTRVA